MTPVDIVRWVHVVGAAILLGTGAGIAFFMLMAHRTRSPTLIAHVAGTVAVADMIFTATAAILQPVTGAALAHLIGWPLTTGWIVLSLCLYVATGLLWLPVVRMQIEMRDVARASPATAPSCRQSMTDCSGSGSGLACRRSASCWRLFG